MDSYRSGEHSAGLCRIDSYRDPAHCVSSTCVIRDLIRSQLCHSTTTHTHEEGKVAEPFIILDENHRFIQILSSNSCFVSK